MIGIRNRVEQGEPLTVELYTAYQIAGESVVRSLSGDEQSLQNLEMQLSCYELQAVGGMGTDAVDQIYDLIEGMPGTDFYAPIYKKAMATAERIGAGLK